MATYVIADSQYWASQFLHATKHEAEIEERLIVAGSAEATVRGLPVGAKVHLLAWSYNPRMGVHRDFLSLVRQQAKSRDWDFYEHHTPPRG